MKLIKISVKNYKIFENLFEFELIKNKVVNVGSNLDKSTIYRKSKLSQNQMNLTDESFIINKGIDSAIRLKKVIDYDLNQFSILTGKNNMGKSTLLETINEFFKESNATNKIPNDCFSELENEIELIGHFYLSDDSQLLKKLLDTSDYNENSRILVIKKIYVKDTKSKCSFYFSGKEISKKVIKDLITKELTNNSPYYIKPNMSTEEINTLISRLYSDSLQGKLQNDSKEMEAMNSLFDSIITKLKKEVDNDLIEVEEKVTETLNSLFGQNDFKLKIKGGIPTSFDAKDLIKNSQTEIIINSNRRSDMLLSEQGTGVQRMSLIYTIQNLINQKIGDFANRMLLVDEPEAFLHPEATRGLSESLYEIGNSMPIIISTHSPILINLENPHKIIEVFKVNNKNNKPITLFNSAKNKFDDDDAKNLKTLNYIDSYVNEFFFSDKVIIVEGDTEKIVLNHIKKEYKSQFHILKANGKSTIETLMKILNQFNMEYFVLHDLDNNPMFSSSSLKAQKTNCKKIYDLNKNRKAQIYALNHTFEKAFYGETVKSSEKTDNIIDMLKSNEEADIEIKNDIIDNFLSMFNIDSNNEVTNKNIVRVYEEEDLNLAFDELIKAAEKIENEKKMLLEKIYNIELKPSHKAKVKKIKSQKYDTILNDINELNDILAYYS